MRLYPVLINRLRIILSDRMFIISMLVIPIILSAIMGYAQRREKLGYVALAVVDEDRTNSSETLIERFSEKEGIHISFCDRDESLKLVREERAEASIIIKRGFEKNLKNGTLLKSVEIIKSPSTISTELIKEIFAAEVIRLRASEFAWNWLESLFKENELSIPENMDVRDRYESYWNPHPIMTVEYEEIEAKPVNQSERVTVPPFAAASLGILVLFIMLALLFGSGWICEERANGTLSRIVSSPGAILHVFIGNSLALLLLGLAQTLVFIAVQKILFNVSMVTGIASWAVLISYMICSVSISMLMAAFFKTASRLQAVAPVFSIITGFIGGCLWNLAGIPEDLIFLSRITPQGWALSALTAGYANPGGISAVLPAIVILLSAALIMLVISYGSLVKEKTVS